ncbi:unnamed protein product [Litomosoides sigmodontis]|uniref:G-protein coupled receptors family 1 profile domain-containing protein n=1 Tax=Litomosoides sigmodontis TaxID=42156 RepID=A0A3P6TRB8_LITSI|nr:unnamed protein product [Litomosoides sigmodontis]
MSSALFFNDGSNGSTVEGPVCAEKGLACPALYKSMEVVSFCSTISDFIIIPLLVYLSVAKVKDCLLKYFTLNLMAICSVRTIAITVVHVINVINLFANVDEHLYQIRRWARRCLSFGYVWSHAMALYVAILCYLAYANPIFYVKHFVNKSQKLHYLILHTVLLAWNSCIDFIRQHFEVFLLHHLTHLILFIVLFIVTIMASIKICNYKPPGVNATYVMKLRRKRLFSFVIYSYATEIVVLPRFLYSLTSVICNYVGCEHQLRQTLFHNIIRQLIRALHELNSIVIVLSTIVAFEPYRQAFIAILGKQKSSTTKIDPLKG